MTRKPYANRQEAIPWPMSPSPATPIGAASCVALAAVLAPPWLMGGLLCGLANPQLGRGRATGTARRRRIVAHHAAGRYCTRARRRLVIPRRETEVIRHALYAP